MGKEEKEDEEKEEEEEAFSRSVSQATTSTESPLDISRIHRNYFIELIPKENFIINLHVYKE